MKFDGTIEIGGRETGSVEIAVTCPPCYGNRFLGIARTYLGNMKREMQLGEIRHMQRSYDMPPIIHETTLGDLISNGAFDGQNITFNLPDKSYLNLLVRVQVYPYIRVSSIRDEEY